MGCDWPAEIDRNEPVPGPIAWGEWERANREAARADRAEAQLENCRSILRRCDIAIGDERRSDSMPNDIRDIVAELAAVRTQLAEANERADMLDAARERWKVEAEQLRAELAAVREEAADNLADAEATRDAYASLRTQLQAAKDLAYGATGGFHFGGGWHNGVVSVDALCDALGCERPSAPEPVNARWVDLFGTDPDFDREPSGTPDKGSNEE